MIDIPTSVTTIGDWAFSYCTSIASVDIPNSVILIGDKAFAYCTGLKEIILKAITPPNIYENTFELVSKTESVLRVPNESVSTYKTADYWRFFWNIVGLNSEDDGESSETEQCAVPTIEILNDKLMASSITEGALCYISVTSDDITSVYGESIPLTGIYNVSSYAYAEGYQNSETVTAKVMWVNPMLDGTSVLNMEAKKAVLIRAINSNIIISGTEQGECIQIYTIEGRQLFNVSANDGQTIINSYLNKGETVIVKYGGRSVKIMM